LLVYACLVVSYFQCELVRVHSARDIHNHTSLRTGLTNRSHNAIIQLLTFTHTYIGIINSHPAGRKRGARLSMGSTFGAETPMHHASMSSLAFDNRPTPGNSTMGDGNTSSWLFRSPTEPAADVPGNKKKGSRLHFGGEQQQQREETDASTMNPFREQTPVQKRRNRGGVGFCDQQGNELDEQDSSVQMLSRTLHRTCSVSARTHANMPAEMKLPVPLTATDNNGDDDDGGFVLSSAFNPASSPGATASKTSGHIRRFARSPVPMQSHAVPSAPRFPPVPTDAFTESASSTTAGMEGDEDDDDTDAFGEAPTPVLGRTLARTSRHSPSCQGPQSSPVPKPQQVCFVLLLHSMLLLARTRWINPDA
jgi:hypothetical protein